MAVNRTGKTPAGKVLAGTRPASPADSGAGRAVPRARIRRPKLSNIIADSLRQHIAKERLKPGDRLPNERSLVEYYGCSKGTVREALRVLEVTGLVKMQTGPNGGAEIQAVSVDAPTQQLRTYLHFLDLRFRDVYAVRCNIEPTLVQSVVGKLTADQFDRLEENIARCRHCRERGDLSTLRLLELDFHEILRESCENPFLDFICGFINGLLRDLLDFNRDEYDTRDAFGQHNIDSHVALLSALRDKDAATVGAIMAQHMHCAEHFMSRLDASFYPDMLKWTSSSESSGGSLF